MAALAGEKLGLQVEEPVPLTPPSAAVSPEGPVAGDDPMAGDDEPDRIAADRAADCAGGAGPPDCARDVPVAPGLPARDRAHGVKDGSIPGRAILEVEGQRRELSEGVRDGYLHVRRFSP